jgi:LysR family transcriptional activator of nhaA
VVLSNRRVPEDAEHAWRSRRIARQQVSLVGPRRRKAFRFPEELAQVPLLLPSRDHDIRNAFDVLCDEWGIRPTVLAEADDMAMLRVLARELEAVTLVPAVVVQDELRDRVLDEYCAVPDLYEEFYAVSVTRQYQPPLLRTLLARRATDVLSE